MNLTDILDELGIAYKRVGEHHHITYGWIGVDCGRCSPNSGKFKLGINVSGLYCSCWSCGGIPLSVALSEITNLPPVFINRHLQDIGYEVRQIVPRTSGRLTIPKGVGPLLPVHRQYLINRGFDPDYLASFWGVQGIGLAAQYPWRLFIPVYYRLEMVSWTTRSLVDAGTRYLNAKPEHESRPIKSVLFGSDHARHAVIVVEGPLDAMRIGAGAVSTLGVGYSEAQFTKIARYPVRVVVFDSEPKAQERARKLCSDLAAFAGKTVRIELASKDPGSASKRDIELLRQEYLE